MSKLGAVGKLLAVGAFSASCGIGGAYVSATQLDLFRGPQGAPGQAGPSGAAGLQGEPGPPGQSATSLDGMWFVASSCGFAAKNRGQVVSGVQVSKDYGGNVTTNVQYLQLCEPSG
jgi:hypothetical protein